MRRKDRECTDPSFFDALLRQADVMTVAFQTEGFPYVIPVNFVAQNGALYIHCAREGRKLECLSKKSGVGFSVHELIDIDREKATTLYRSICGEGTASLVEDREEKQTALAALARKYQSRCTLPVPDGMLKVTAVIRIDIAAMTGKQHLPETQAG